MDLENILMVGIGVIIFLYSFSQRESYITVTFFWCLGIILVYLGLKRSEKNKKKGKNK